MGLFNLGDSIEEIALESIGFTGSELSDLNSTIASCHSSANNTVNMTELYERGTAIDQIQLCIGVTPDVVNTTWISEMYQTVAELAMALFWIFFICALIGYILKKLDKLSPDQESTMVHLIKRSIISSFMVYNGLPIMMMLLLLNQQISEVFGGGASVIGLLVHTLLSPQIGSLLILGSAGAIGWVATFYIIRMLLIFISCAVWAIAWVLWIWDRTSTFAVFLLTIIVVNIFLGSAMTLVYWVGTLCILSETSTGYLVSWGSDMLGLVIMLIAGFLPILAFWFFLFNPTAFVKKTVFVVAKLV